MTMENRKEIEEIRKANQDTINTSHNMVELINQYLHTNNEEEKKKIFSEILSPRLTSNNSENTRLNR
jgi:hypothetical protein